MASQPEIKSDSADLLLRPWTTEDADQVYDAFQDRHIRRWHLRTMDTKGEAVAWIKEWASRWADHSGASWAATAVGETGRVIGQVAFRSLYLADGLAELSCWVVPDSRLRHVASTATRALANWALNDLGIERLEIVHSTRNGPACLAAMRAGFQPEGTKRRLQRYQDGFHDMHLHSRVRGD